jgi:hypothetical protein
VAVQVDGNDLARPGERGEHGAEHVDGPEPAVQEQERLTRAVDLVVVVDSVRLHASTLRRLGSGVHLRLDGIGGSRNRQRGSEHEGGRYDSHWDLLASFSISVVSAFVGPSANTSNDRTRNRHHTQFSRISRPSVSARDPSVQP